LGALSGAGGVKDQTELIGTLVVGGDLAVDVLSVVARPRWLPSETAARRELAVSIASNSFLGSTHCQPVESFGREVVAFLS
jgi:hypothetical protein